MKSLKAVKEKGTKETEFELFKVVENVEAMRLQIKMCIRDRYVGGHSDLFQRKML